MVAIACEFLPIIANVYESITIISCEFLTNVASGHASVASTCEHLMNEAIAQSIALATASFRHLFYSRRRVHMPVSYAPFNTQKFMQKNMTLFQEFLLPKKLDKKNPTIMIFF